MMFYTATTRRALSGQLCYSTQIPVCLWFLAEDKNADATPELRDRLGFETAIGARSLIPFTASMQTE